MSGKDQPPCPAPGFDVRPDIELSTQADLEWQLTPGEPLELRYCHPTLGWIPFSDPGLPTTASVKSNDYVPNRLAVAATGVDTLRLYGTFLDNDDGDPVMPSLDVIRAGTYRPLSRPMFVYVNKESYKRPEVKAFLEFFLDNARRIVEHPTVNYVALPDEMYELGRRRLNAGKTGSAMTAAKGKGLDLTETFKRH